MLASKYAITHIVMLSKKYSRIIFIYCSPFSFNSKGPWCFNLRIEVTGLNVTWTLVSCVSIGLVGMDYRDSERLENKNKPT